MKLSHFGGACCCRGKGGLIAIAIAIFVCIISQNSKAGEFAAIEVTEKGQGPALIFIPGLNSAEETFTDTCAAFVATHRCYLLHLPGFAGRAPMALERGFLEPIKDNIIAFINENNLSSVTLVGHSLGGLLSLMITLDAPEKVNRVVVIDSLPFYPAVQNQALTIEVVKPQAELMRTQMLATSDEDYRKNAAMSVNGMSNQASRQPTLIEWSQRSDRATTAQAMYELMTTDLRAKIADMQTPVMVLGAWAAYKDYGSTQESTRAIFAAQYAQLKNVDIRMSETAFHFITWDDSNWANQQIKQFLNVKNK